MKKKKEKRKRRGDLLLFLMAVGLGAFALSSITLLPYATFCGHVDSPGSIDDSGNRGYGAVIPTAMAASATATDGNGAVIEDNGLTKSGEITITGYSDSSYSTELHCSIDSLPMYCSGSPVTISEFPSRQYVFTMVEPINDEITVETFSWDISIKEGTNS